MTEFILDLTNYRETIGANVPEGRYTVIVDDAQMDKSKAGNPMINMWYRIIDGDQKDLVLTDRLTLTEKAMFRVVGFMQAAGMPTPKKKLKLNLNAFVGKTLDVDVQDGEPYNGRVRSEVKGYMRAEKVAKAAPAAEVWDLPEEAPSEDPWAPEEAQATEAPEASTTTPTQATFEASDQPIEVNLDEIDLG